MGKGIRTLSPAPQRRGRGQCLGAPGTSTVGRAPPRWQAPRSRFPGGSGHLPSLHCILCPPAQQGTRGPEDAWNAVGTVPPGVVRHTRLNLGNARWSAFLPLVTSPPYLTMLLLLDPALNSCVIDVPLPPKLQGPHWQCQKQRGRK